MSLWLKVNSYNNGIYSSIKEQLKFFNFSSKEPSIKDVRTPRGEVYPVQTFCGQGGRGILQMHTSALYDAKTLDFSKFMVCHCVRMDRGGKVQPVQTMGVNFLRFCVDSFMDGP